MAGRRILTLAALVACLVSGCSDAESDPGPAASSPSPSASTSGAETGTETGSTEPDEKAPTMPGGASRDTLKGAEAFVRHYIDLLNYAANTGHVAPLRNASAPRCGGCADYAETYASTYRNGGFIRTSGWRPTSIIPVREGRVVTVLVDVDAPDIIYRRRAGGEKKRGRGGVYKLRYEIAQQGGKWRVQNFTEQPNV